MVPIQILAVAIVLCALMAVRARELLTAAIWLAGTSALVALLLYLLGAVFVAVIELSVGAGLVTVLLVLAVSMAQERELVLAPAVPRAFAWALVVGVSALLLAFLLPSSVTPPALTEVSFSEMLWQQRSLDVMLQVVLIFAGVVGILGLLQEGLQPERERLRKLLIEEESRREEAALFSENGRERETETITEQVAERELERV